MTQTSTHPHDLGLPPGTVRKRRRNRSLAYWMLAIAILTAIPGWTLYASSVHDALRIRDQSPYLALLAYALLIVSSITLVLGLWYLLLAQVRRLAHIVGEDEYPADPVTITCPNCGWPHDPPDRYCRHCGKPLSPSIVAPRSAQD